MDQANTPNIPVKSVVRMFEIVEILQEEDGATMSEVVDLVDLSKSTVYNHLSTLNQLEYVVRQNKEYHLSFRFLDHGGHTLSRDPRLQIVEPKVREIADKTNELCQFVIEEHGRGVIIFRETGENAVETRTRLGSRLHLHHTTAGKAILSHLSEERVKRILERHGLPGKTTETITDPDVLFEELDRVKDQGYVSDKVEHIEGLHAVGVPILDSGDVFGAISVAGPAHRMGNESREREIADLILGTVNEIELNISFLE